MQQYCVFFLITELSRARFKRAAIINKASFSHCDDITVDFLNFSGFLDFLN